MFIGRRAQVSYAAVIAPQVAPSHTLGMELEFAQISDRGRVREGNEDYLGSSIPESLQQARAHGWLFAVADGVGGHDLGEVASQTAVQALVGGFRESTPGESHSALLGRLVQTANTRVLDAGHDAGPGGRRMATTLVACALRYDRVTVAHVGDSRLYLIRGGEARCLTRDHTVVGEQVRLGLMTKEEASRASTRHLLSRSVGSELLVNVDVAEHHVLAGDVLLLCTDGLHASVRPEDMAAATADGAGLETAARSLVEIANQRDGSDNISLQLIRVRSVERVGMYRGRPYRLP